MSEVRSEFELLGCFRPIDRPEFHLPAHTAYPLVVKDVFVWSEGPRVYLLLGDQGGALPKGVVFHRSTGGMPEVAAMCAWCYAVRANGGVKLLTVATDERRSIGLYLCSDLGCTGRAKESPSPDDLREHIDGERRHERILSRMSSFVAEHLF